MVIKMKSLTLKFLSATRHRAIPKSDWWGLAWDTNTPLMDFDRRFEIHPYRVWESGMAPPLDKRAKYTQWLNCGNCEVVLWEKRKDIKNSSSYPINKITKMHGVGNYLASSMAYMLCLAVLEGRDHIMISGCDFDPYEWQEICFERPNLAYLIGLFRAKGIEIEIPTMSTLWELSLLDGLEATVDFKNSSAKRFHLEYLLGRWIGGGNKNPTNLRSDIYRLPWKRVPYYGHETLEEVGAFSSKYSFELRRELGIVI